MSAASSLLRQTLWPFDQSWRTAHLGSWCSVTRFADLREIRQDRLRSFVDRSLSSLDHFGVPVVPPSRVDGGYVAEVKAKHGADDERDALSFGLSLATGDVPAFMITAHMADLVQSDMHTFRKWVTGVDVDDAPCVVGVASGLSVFWLLGELEAIGCDHADEGTPSAFGCLSGDVAPGRADRAAGRVWDDRRAGRQP